MNAVDAIWFGSHGLGALAFFVGVYRLFHYVARKMSPHAPDRTVQVAQPHIKLPTAIVVQPRLHESAR